MQTNTSYESVLCSVTSIDYRKVVSQSRVSDFTWFQKPAGNLDTYARTEIVPTYFFLLLSLPSPLTERKLRGRNCQVKLPTVAVHILKHRSHLGTWPSIFRAISYCVIDKGMSVCGVEECMNQTFLIGGAFIFGNRVLTRLDIGLLLLKCDPRRARNRGFRHKYLEYTEDSLSVARNLYSVEE